MDRKGKIQNLQLNISGSNENQDFTNQSSRYKRRTSMFKKVTHVVISMVLILLFFPHDTNRVQAAQTIRLPFPPLYSYNPANGSFSQNRVPITDACQDGQGAAGTHIEHTRNARFAVDFGMRTGTPVYAPVSGDVVYAAYTAGYGLLMRIRESSEREHYLAHLSKFYVTSGRVNQGDLVALSGETGKGPAHLHYHVQKPGGGTAIQDADDVRDELPGINWIDSSDYCNQGGAIDGTAHASPLPNGGSPANNCAEFYNQGRPGVWGFDAPNCQGNVVFGSLSDGTNFNLAQNNVNDRLRSISARPNLHFWLYAHTDSESLKHCHEKDMWNLDTDNYNFTTTDMIGWDSDYDKQNVGGGELVSTGYNMVSRLRVVTEACPQNQGSRVQAYEISTGYGIGGGGDITSPETSASFIGTEGNNNWYVSPVTVVLSAYDEFDVAHTYYRINGGNITEGTSFSLDVEGIYAVEFWSEDSSGNVESTKSVPVKIDWTPPETTCEVLGSRDMLGIFRSPVDNTCSATDNLSGPDYTEYSFDNGNTWNLYGGVFTLSDNGVYEYLFRSVDIAGNVEDAKPSGVIDIKRFVILTNSLTSNSATTLQTLGVAHTNGNAGFTNNNTVHLQTLEYLGQFTQSGNVSFTIDNLVQSSQVETLPLYPLSFYRDVCTFIPGPIIDRSTSRTYNECWYVDGDITLETTGSTGNLTIISEGVIYDRSTNSHLSAWDTTNGILYYARRGYVTESGGAVYNGVIYAPYSSVSGPFTNSTLSGGIFANNLSLSAGTSLSAQQAAGFPPSTYPLPLIAVEQPVPNIIYVSSMGGGTVGGIATADEDILTYNREQGSYAMFIDGSDIGLSYTDIDAFFALPDGTFLMSFDSSISVSPLGTVYYADIVRFTPTSLGSTTAGTFEWYFDGSDVGLTTSDEDIDAIGFTPHGKLVVSTLGYVSVTGVSGNDEDLIVFTPTSLGANTAGTWAWYFDGSDVGLNESSYEDINGIWIDPVTGQIYLTTVGSFSVSGLSGDGADIFICTPSSLGSTTACTYGPGLYWDGSKNGFSGKVLDSVVVQK
ncbi:hypothetical protein A2962_02380 [Candidatus Woesebacteria bacterium RIFCSPLOWO2_01_FULL_39_61]|nr:MAG: hypothetical protein A2962_02380 [Candidatus Woesebacteria bacterium RIFCSPLOWO2_01_FULL_39_61]